MLHSAYTVCINLLPTIIIIQVRDVKSLGPKKTASSTHMHMQYSGRLMRGRRRKRRRRTHHEFAAGKKSVRFSVLRGLVSASRGLRDGGGGRLRWTYLIGTGMHSRA